MTRIRTWEVVLIAVGLFFICSTSLYWYDRVNKSRPHSIENEMRKQWEKKTTGWQEDVTVNINNLAKWQKTVTDLLNANIANGRLTIPKQESK